MRPGILDQVETAVEAVSAGDGPDKMEYEWGSVYSLKNGVVRVDLKIANIYKED